MKKWLVLRGAGDGGGGGGGAVRSGGGGAAGPEPTDAEVAAHVDARLHQVMHGLLASEHSDELTAAVPGNVVASGAARCYDRHLRSLLSPTRGTCQKSVFQLAVGDRVVYPNQGVCRVTAIDVKEVAGQKLTFVTMSREEDGAVVMVPQAKVAAIGVRKVATRRGGGQILRVPHARTATRPTWTGSSAPAPTWTG